jgi:fibronectin type 3 domain-containing protein
MVFVMILSMVTGLSSLTLMSPAAAATPTGAILNTHAVMVDDQGKLVSWVNDQSQAYATVVTNAWNYLLTNVPVAEGGLPAYYTHSMMNPDTQLPVGWPHNPAGLYSMLIESALDYYAYSGDIRVMTAVQDLATYQLDHGMTLATDAWAGVPYASADGGATTYHGATYGNTTGVGDGDGVIEPDKVGELGEAWLTLYEYSGNTRFRDAAIAAADALAAHVRPGDATHSPWPFRVVASTGAIKEEYSAHTVSALELYDGLIRLGLGATSTYRSVRAAVLTWTLTYPVTNGSWSGYFEDVAYGTSTGNPNQLNALMFARYLLENPSADPSWEAHVRALIGWVETTFGVADTGATTIREQAAFPHAMGSHTSRYAAVNALLYAKTGDLTAKEKAYRAFNWATYMARANGVDIDGPEVNNEWFTDGYGDYIRHFMVGMGAVPEWSPPAQTHILSFTAPLSAVSYSSTEVDYTAAEPGGVEELHVTSAPTEVAADGAALSRLTDLTGPGYTYDPAGGVLHVRHDGATAVKIFFTGAPGNQVPSVSLTGPAVGSTFTPPATVTLTATASDPDGRVTQVEFFNGSTSLGSSATAPYTVTWSNVGPGTYNLVAKATDDAGAVVTSSVVPIRVTSLTAGWSQADVGSVGVAGDAATADGTFTVKGAGVDIWDSADSFHYVYQPLNGNGQIIARVVTQQNTDPWALAGVMIRESTAAGSREAIAAITPGNGVAFTWRSSTGGSSSYTSGSAGTVPIWLKLVRNGTAITAFRSANGTSWTQFASTTLSMATSVTMGLAVTSHNNPVLAVDTFDSVSSVGSADTTPPVVSAIAVSALNQNGATITWTTNEPADSQLAFGPTTAYGGLTTLNGSLVTAHSQVISGLDASATYHFQVRSRDAAGNLATAADQTFTTPAPPDTVAPSAPTNLGATASTATQVGLSWTAADDNVLVTGYLVKRDGTQIARTNGTSYTDGGLAPGSAHSYTVVAVDAAGNQSPESAPASVTLPADTTAPTAPGNLTASAVGTTQVSLTWTAATDDVGVTGYRIRRTGLSASTTGATTYLDTGLVPGGSYAYTVTAVDAAGNESAASSVASIVLPAPDIQAPSAPSALTAIATSAGNVTLSWTAATDDVGVARYNISRGGALLATTTTPGYLDPTVVGGTTYSYTVTAQDAAGNIGPAAGPAVVTTPVAPTLGLDTQVVVHGSSASTSITSPSLSTAGTNELLVAFLASDGPATSTSAFTSVATSGLTWTLRKRMNTQYGTAEIWTAPAAAKLSKVTVKASRSGSYRSSLVVAAFKGASLTTIGAVGGASAGSGAPTATVTTTRAGSWVWGVGNDWDRATARTVGTGQTKVDEFLTPNGDTFWVQRSTDPSPVTGTVVTVNDTAPTTERWNLAVIEVLPQ